ncbi:hypothetical protein NH340_JMT03230 [Sarcoptes scabiei]|nr:hypothetical protein NH340_JMT03230 [Sarcoptes scabiei]
MKQKYSLELDKDPQFMVDPDFIYDLYPDNDFKLLSDDTWLAPSPTDSPDSASTSSISPAPSSKPSTSTATSSHSNLLDESITSDLINCTDSQLEDLILKGSLYNGLNDLTFDEIDAILDGNSQNLEADKSDFDIENFLPIISHRYNCEKILPILDENSNELEQISFNSPTTFDFDDDNIANYEEVYASVEDQSDMSSDQKFDCYEPSKHSFIADEVIGNNDGKKIESSIKLEELPEHVEKIEIPRPKRKSSTRICQILENLHPRNSRSRFKRKVNCYKRRRRNLNDDIKYQNKLSALKYRERKRNEIKELEESLVEHEKKNLQLRSLIEEYEMEIGVFKELLSKRIAK